MREIEVLQLVADGLVNREIGQRLFLSEETVKSHVRHLLAKLQARSRAHAVSVGFRRGLIRLAAPRASSPERETHRGRAAAISPAARPRCECTARKPVFPLFPQSVDNSP